MENARALDDRLNKIIREVGTRTGNEIKKDLVSEIDTKVKSNSTAALNRTLALLKRALDEL